MEDNYKEGLYMENLCDTMIGFIVGAMLAFTYSDRIIFFIKMVMNKRED